MNKTEKFEIVEQHIDNKLINPIEQFETQARLSCAPERSIKSVITARNSRNTPELKISKKGHLLILKHTLIIYIYSIPNRKCVQIIPSNGAYFNCANISPDEKFIITGEPGGTITIWDTTTAKKVIEINNPKDRGVGKLEITPDNSKFVMKLLNKKDKLSVFDFKTGKRLYKVGNEVRDYALSSNGKTAYYSENKEIISIDLQSGKIIKIYKLDGYVDEIAISDDNQTIVAIESDENYEGSNKKIRVLDIQNETSKLIKTKTSRVHISLNPQGNILFTNDSYYKDSKLIQKIDSWNLEEGNLYDLGIDLEKINFPIVFGPHDERIYFYQNSNLFYFDIKLKTTNLFWSINLLNSYLWQKAPFSLENKMIVVCNDKRINRWNLDEGTIDNISFNKIDQKINEMVSNNDATLLAYKNSEKQIEVWEIDKHDCLYKWESENISFFQPIAFSKKKDQNLIAYVDRKKIYLRDFKNGRLLKYFDFRKGSIKHIEFCDDSQTLFSESYSNLTWWDIEWGRPILNIESPRDKFPFYGHKIAKITCSKVDVDNFICLIADNYSEYRKNQSISENRVHIFDLKNGLSSQFTTDYQENIELLCIDSKMKTIISASKYGNIIKWNIETGEKMHVFSEYSSLKSFKHIQFIEFRKNGNQLVIGNTNGEVYFWDYLTGEFLAKTYNLDHGYLWITPPDIFAPNGWLFTNRPDLVSLIEMNKDDNKNPAFIYQDDIRFKEYMKIYNDKEMVLTRINDYQRYQELLNIRLENKKIIKNQLQSPVKVKLLAE